MHGYTQDFTRQESVDPRLTIIQTTLYDLVEAVSEQVQPEQEQLVAIVVSHLIQNRRSECWA